MTSKIQKASIKIVAPAKPSTIFDKWLEVKLPTMRGNLAIERMLRLAFEAGAKSRMECQPIETAPKE